MTTNGQSEVASRYETWRRAEDKFTEVAEDLGKHVQINAQQRATLECASRETCRSFRHLFAAALEASCPADLVALSLAALRCPGQEEDELPGLLAAAVVKVLGGEKVVREIETFDGYKQAIQDQKRLGLAEPS